jgi:two-component system, OmpR family, sensor histidine kinase KdpD
VVTDGERRPDPDRLLEAIQRQEQKAAKGKLKVFLGMAAGVGKTYDMLSSAHELRSRGVDVVAGLVETHGRQETEALLAGLAVIPRRSVSYHDVTLTEMDLDAILARRPAVVLVDEAAHTNAPESRHEKRWQDILELLDAGIDVYTTLNIQHLESLSDTVREITGITIKETVPDSIIDVADKVILVDLAPEELLQRLQEGKVYGEERAERAMENFFRPVNLSALRELALRMVAERVNREVRDYQQVHPSAGAWKTGHRLMVAVYASPYSEMLIRRTRRIASSLDARWYGAYVESDQPLSAEESRLLARNLSLVHELGGEVVTTVDDDAVRGLIRLAADHQVTQIVAGKSRRGSWHNFLRGGSIMTRLLKDTGDVDVYVVAGEPGARPESRDLPPPGSRRFMPPRDFALAAAAPAVVAAIGWLVSPLLSYQATGLLFLLAVTLLGMTVGRSAVLMSAVLSGLIWDFFFIPPRFTFSMSNLSDIIMVAMFIGVAGVIGHLTTRLRLNERHLRIREQRLMALYQFSRAIGTSRSREEMLARSVRHVEDVFDAQAAIMVPDADGRLEVSAGELGALDDKEMAVAQWAFLHHRPAGRFTDTLPTARNIYFPLIGQTDAVGVLGISPRNQRPDTPELTALAETFAFQLGRALDHTPGSQAESGPAKS